MMSSQSNLSQTPCSPRKVAGVLMTTAAGAFVPLRPVQESGSARVSQATGTHSALSRTCTPRSSGKFRIEPVRENVPRQHEVAGELFEVQSEEGMIFLTHESWSLVGMGKTLAEAEADLIEEARLAQSVYVDVSPSRLTAEALDLREFILDIL